MAMKSEKSVDSDHSTYQHDLLQKLSALQRPGISSQKKRVISYVGDTELRSSSDNSKTPIGIADFVVPDEIDAIGNVSRFGSVIVKGIRRPVRKMNWKPAAEHRLHFNHVFMKFEVQY
jgi:hypothetical protein